MVKWLIFVVDARHRTSSLSRVSEPSSLRLRPLASALLFALAVLVPLHAHAQRLPKQIDVGTTDRWQRLEARLNLMRERDPAHAAQWESVLALKSSARNLMPAPLGEQGAGFSEGNVEEVATNGKVVAWSNDTFFGSLTFARADDLAHPVAFVGDAGVWTLPTTMQFDGDTLYVNAVTRILAFDCSNPDDIKLKATFDTSCYSANLDSIQTLYTNDIRDFRVRNGLLYAALGQAGFVVYDVNQPTYPVLAANPLLVNESDNPDFATLQGNAYFNFVEVTDTTMILIGGHASGNYPMGEVWTWDIRDRSDPMHTFHLWQQPKGYSNPFQPLLNGQPVFSNSLDAQIAYAGDSLFASNSRAQSDGWGVARFQWSDLADFSTLQPKAGLKVSFVNDGTTGPAKLVRSFSPSADGKTVWAAFRNSNDSSIWESMPDAVAAQKWDWAQFDAPAASTSYVTDRFFYNDVDSLNSAYGNPPPKLSWVAFYGANGLALAPQGGNAEVYLAGYNYLGAFDATGSLVGHYTAGANYLAFNSPPNPPAGASILDVTATPDGKTVAWWFPEGVSFLDVATGTRVGAWEVPNNKDFVHNVAITADGHYALVSCGSLGLITLDISNPANVQQVGQWWTNPTASAEDRQPVTYVFEYGGHAFVQTRVRVTDVANPVANHNVVRVLDLKNAAQPLEVNAYDYAVGDGSAGTVFWDVSDMKVVVGHGKNATATLLVANGQGADDGLGYNALYGNSSADLTTAAPAASVITANVTNAAMLQQIANLPVTVAGKGAYSRMIAVQPDASGTPHYAWVAAGKLNLGSDRPYINPHFPIGPSGVGGLALLDVSNPASIAELNSFDQVGNARGLHIDKVYAVRGANQLVLGFDNAGLNVIDITNPMTPSVVSLPGEADRLVQAGFHFTQLADDSWMLIARNTANLWHLVNDPDMVAPQFSPVGPNSDGWLSPGCDQEPCGELDAPTELKVQVTDDVAVTKVHFYALFANSPGSVDQPWNACSPGFIDLGEGTQQDGDVWSLTVGPDDFHWTGLVYFVAQAYDAGGNVATAENLNGRWYVTGVQATASADPAMGSAPLNVTFDGGAQGARGPFTYAWDFGDGSTSTEENPSHIYEQPGNYAAKLTVTDTSGRTAVTTVAITVIEPTQLAAMITASVKNGTAPLAVDFHAAVAGGSGDYDIVWNFGDGSRKATGTDVSHTFTTPGTYTVALTVHDDAGHTANASVTVNVDAVGGQSEKASGCGCTTTEGNAAMLLPALLGLVLLRRRRYDVV